MDFLLRMLKKEVEREIKESFGEDVVKVVGVLRRRKNFSEFKLAEKINKDLNYTRNLLYRLYQKNLASFIRRKDKKRGWYIYYWSLNDDGLKRFLIGLNKRKIERLKAQIKNEAAGGFFICEGGCMRLDFDQAINFDFKCPECGRLMGQEDSETKIRELKKRIKRIENNIKAFS